MLDASALLAFCFANPVTRLSDDRYWAICCIPHRQPVPIVQIRA